MVSADSVHAELQIRCGARLTDDDGEPIENDHGNQEVCSAELTGTEHARFVQSPRGEDRHGTRLQERFTQSALKFTCSDCGAATWVCPVCSEDGDNTPPGYFRGDSTGDQLPCHNCNMEEVQRQRRDPHNGVTY